MPFEVVCASKPFNRIAIRTILGCLFVGFFITSIQEVNAQNTESDFSQQLWLDYDPSWNVGDGEKIVGNIGVRTIWPKSWHRYILKGSYQKTFDKLIFKDKFIFKRIKHTEKLLWGTGLYLLTTEEEGNYGSFEVRPFQGYQLGFKIRPRVQFNQLLRLEERFVFSKEPGNQVFGLRFRYKVTAIFNLEGLVFSKDQGFYMPVSVEAFFNLVSASQFNDVIRVSPGIGYQFNKDFKLEANLSYQYTKNYTDTNGTNNLVRSNDIVYQFKVIKTFNTK
ncbi:DUF2490 domain-containing protein [Formosa sp. PL04]|uniref:DUF2490 domain-containing protein n=1 Tax=Formosa sp. PL04 TaxID=3081755 RepID=UPI0029825F49|nr:DUF2490 domain-containing protein [Formosa sp. PL04]MDW5287494.1 DUF2490 domain-containing protein [Formosa sp. PL04]